MRAIIMLVAGLAIIIGFVEFSGGPNPDRSAEAMAYYAPSANAREFMPGLSYIILQAPSVSEERRAIVRTLSDLWSESGEQLADADADGLSTTRPDTIRDQFPFLATMLEATPDGAKYRWWIAADAIPEGTPGFARENHMMDIRVVDSVNPMVAPDNVAAIPDDAYLTPQGVGYMVLEASESELHPTPDDMIEVYYTGWQTDGTMFDSAVLREKANIFPLGRLIAGWQDAVPLMVVGEKARIWIPGALAYDNRPDRPNAPKGMLVFDVELVSIPGPAEAAQPPQAEE
jgi:FKBP-type peptidyl-prolyl cis-trans isomerase